MADIMNNPDDAKIRKAAAATIADMCQAFPIYGGMLETRGL